MRGVPSSSSGRVIGLRRSGKALLDCCVLVGGRVLPGVVGCTNLGKKARMKIARKMTVFRRLVSKGI